MGQYKIGLIKRIKGNKNFVLFTICLSSSLVSLNNGSLNIAIPTLVNVFETSIETASWIVTSFLISMTLFVLHAGKLSDLFGRKKTYIFGILLFMTFSFYAGITKQVSGLIIARIFQGIGSAIIVANSTPIITDIFAENKRGTSLGLVAMSLAIGSACGPMLGGFILLFSWSWLFWFNIPLCLLILISAILAFPNQTSPRVKQKFDIKGTIALLLFLLSLLFVFTYALPNSWQWHHIALCFTISALSFVLFLFIEKKAADPIIQLELFKNKNYSIANICTFGNTIGQSCAMFVMIIYLQSVKGFSSFEASLIIMAIPLFLALSGPFCGRLADRFGSKILTSIGLLILSGGLFIISFIRADTSMLYLIAALSIIGLGSGIFQTPNTRTIMNLAPAHSRGVVSATRSILNTIARLTSTSLSVGALGIVLPKDSMSLPFEAVDQFVVLVRLLFVGATCVCMLSFLLILFTKEKKRQEITVNY